jgi:hypothetical protein
MGQEQPRTGEGRKMQEKVATPEKDRTNAKFERRIENTPAMSWKDSKPDPLSKPT